MVNPWESPRSVLLAENRNADSIGGSTSTRGSGRRRRGVGGHESHISGRFTGRSVGGDRPRRQRAVKGEAKVGDSEVIRKKLNERSSFRKSRTPREQRGRR